MLTLNKDKQNREICEIVKGKKTVGILYWHPRRTDEFKNKIQNMDAFNTPYLRDMYELSRAQATSIFDHLKRKEVDVSNQKAYFKVKKHIDTSIFTEWIYKIPQIYSFESVSNQNFCRSFK